MTSIAGIVVEGLISDFPHQTDKERRTAESRPHVSGRSRLLWRLPRPSNGWYAAAPRKLWLFTVEMTKPRHE
jgi:hypothetical protein